MTHLRPRFLGADRPLRVLVAVFAALLVLTVASATTTPVAGAQDVDENVVTTTTGQVPGFGHIIPQPNSGHAPRDATDRGGWAQFAVLGGIVFGICLIVGLVWLESRRKRRRAAAAASPDQTASSTRSEPVADSSTKRPDSNARQ